jgi:glutamyl-tRNA reductase
VIVGAGETAEHTARALADQGVRTMFVANRRAHRALALAERFGGSVAALDELPALLERADIVVTSTASPHAIIGAEELDVVLRRRRERGGGPLALIDIAVPRDVDPACGDLPGVHRFDMDDLQGIVAGNLEVRDGERDGAEALVEEELRRFAAWMGQRDVAPTVAALREHGSAIVERVLAENASRWESASPRDVARVEAMARAVMQRLLHEPTIRLKALQESGDHARQQVVRELFGLQEGTDAQGPPAEAPAEVRELRRRRP